MKTLKNSLAGLAFAFAMVAAFAFSAPQTNALASPYQSIADNTEGTVGCTSSSGFVAASCTINGQSTHCKDTSGKFVFELTGCKNPLKRP